MSNKITPLGIIFTLVAMLSAPLAASRAAERPAAGRPNLLFLITDQQTAGALSCEGNPYVKTPNLDRLAARGMRFEKSYCTYPLCCPSRGSLFTSRMPHELGIYGNFDAELSEKGVPTMGELFQAAGYETAYAGKWHVQVPFPAFKSRKIPGFAVLPLAGKDPHSVDLTKEGKTVPWREFVVSETVSGADARMVRTARYKYVLFGQGENREQFFDMEADPGETSNLIADASLAGEIDRHRGLLKQWMEDTHDAFGKAPARATRNQRRLPRRTPPNNTTPFRSNPR